MINLGSLPDLDSCAATAINDSGQVIGFCYQLPLAPEIRSFVYDHGTFTDLGNLPNAFNTVPNGINKNGQIVGQSNDPNGQSAFLYDNGKIRNLNNLIPADSGWTLSEASAINEAGQIVGTGQHNGFATAFLLTPK